MSPLVAGPPPVLILRCSKPFLITYLCTATFTLYLLRPAYTHFVSKRTEASRNGHAGYGSTASARKLHGSLAP